LLNGGSPLGALISADPGALRLPPSRQSGADPFKLVQQIQRFGSGTAGMPALQVTRGLNGEMMINDGVTRATRIAKLIPGATIVVEVIDDRPQVSFAHLARIRERL